MTQSGRKVLLRFLLGEKVLFSLPLQVAVRNASLSAGAETTAAIVNPLAELVEGLDGLLINMQPIEETLAKIEFADGYLRYAPRQYTRCYIDFAIGKEAYLEQFSSKTRSGLNRKVKKFEQLSGTLEWSEYRAAEEMPEFFRLARQISVKTYQERLLNAGLPGGDDYLARAKELASHGMVRAYVLSAHTKPVTYLYCPGEHDTLIYAYLGYDPEFAQHSPGGVLHWLVFQKLFDDGDFRFFDFGQGQGDHKSLFSSHAKQCADVYFLKRNVTNVAKVLVHAGWETLMGATVMCLDRVGVKKWLKKCLRRI